MTYSTREHRRSALPHATIQYLDGVAYNVDYSDVYFSPVDPAGESDHVFVLGNDLPRRFRRAAVGRPFVVGETGFGSGLNILRVADCFLAHAPNEARLHCVSVEGQPLRPQAAARLLNIAGVASDCREALLSQWPPGLVGVHRLWLHPRITVDLHLGSIEQALTGLLASVDAWLLDGFAPDRNPDMWCGSVLRAIAAHSRPGATLATFTSAGWVRRGLTAAGFECELVDGFGQKRSMLTARFSAATQHQPPEDRSRPGWTIAPSIEDSPKRVAVIGAGLAGASVANALAARGMAVSVIDLAGVAGGASGNRQAATYVRLPADVGVAGAFYVACMNYTLGWLRQLDPGREYWCDCGLLQMALSSREAHRQQRVIDFWSLPKSIMRGVDRDTAADLAATSLSETVQGALYFPSAGWVHAAALCEHLLARHAIDVLVDRVVELSQGPDGWRLNLESGGSPVFDTVVLATAGATTSLCSDLPPLDAVRGQISTFNVEGLEESFLPRCVICSQTYALPPFNGHMSVGATYSMNDNDPTPRIADDRVNISGLASAMPGLAGVLDTLGSAESRVGWRATTPDRLPLIGPVPDRAQWLWDYAALRRDATKRLETPATHQTGLWVSAGHGSCGVVSAPLAAEMLASAIAGEPAPVDETLINATNPGRWIIRALCRNRL